MFVWRMRAGGAREAVPPAPLQTGLVIRGL